jgi:hypothetical protein
VSRTVPSVPPSRRPVVFNDVADSRATYRCADSTSQPDRSRCVRPHYCTLAFPTPLVPRLAALGRQHIRGSPLAGRAKCAAKRVMPITSGSRDLLLR